jgi:septal ring factor EnvC (AmiA/AmiB activator)
MDKVEFTVVEAAILYDFSRQKIYNSIKSGSLSKNRKGKLDFSELLRCYGEPKENDTPVSFVQSKNKTMDKNLTELDNRELESLRRQLEESKEREQFYQEQIRSLTDTVKLLEHKRTPESERKRGLLGRLFN